MTIKVVKPEIESETTVVGVNQAEIVLLTKELNRRNTDESESKVAISTLQMW